jgi:hypothetical protein
MNLTELKARVTALESQHIPGLDKLPPLHRVGMYSQRLALQNQLLTKVETHQERLTPAMAVESLVVITALANEFNVDLGIYPQLRQDLPQDVDTLIRYAANQWLGSTMRILHSTRQLMRTFAQMLEGNVGESDEAAVIHLLNELFLNWMVVYRNTGTDERFETALELHYQSESPTQQ